MDWIWWTLLAVMLLGGEILTSGFFLMWLGAGALLGAGLSFIGLPLAWQWLGFVLSSSALMVFSRTLFQRLCGARFGTPPIATNVDALVDKTATVLKAIDNERASGLVTLRGETWSARSEDGQPIAAGKRVLVLRVEGVKLVVMEQP